MQPLRPGDPTEIGRYRLVGRLGSGGMGQVFLGRSPGGRQVAVKTIHRHLLDEDPTFRSRFEHEVEAAKRVGGFYTAAIVDSDAAGDPPWYASAYIDAPTLHDVVDRDGPLDGRRARALGAGLAEALQAIHAAGLVHRDLKPSNVLVAPDGPRVIDFGIVRVADAGTALTGTGMRVGTIGYLSPEQLHGQHVTAASDVFALGVLLVYATARHLPFPGSTDVAVARRMEQPPDLTGVPDRLRSLLHRCLASDPARRPSIDELLAQFADPVEDRRGSRAQPAGKPVRPTRPVTVPQAGRVPPPRADPQRPPPPDVAAAAVPPAPGRRADAEPAAREAPPRPTHRVAPSVEEEPSEYDRWNRGPRPEAPLAAAWLGGLLVAALTTVELHLLLTPSWWGTWPAALGAGALTAVLAVGALRAGQTATPEDQEFGSLAAELLLAILAGVGGAVLAWSSWGLPWWGAVAAGVATTVVAFLFALVVGYASSRTGVAHCASAVAFGATLIGGAALLRGPGASMWVVGLAVSVTWAVLANLLARILSVGAPPAPARPSGAEPDAAG